MKKRSLYPIIVIKQGNYIKLGGLRMNDYIRRVKETINKNKKRLIKRISILLIMLAVLGGVGSAAVYSIAKSNIKYTVEEAKELVIQTTGGEVLKVNKSIELETLSFEYEFKVKDSNNFPIEVTVDSNLGVITDIDED